MNFTIGKLNLPFKINTKTMKIQSDLLIFASFVNDINNFQQKATAG